MSYSLLQGPALRTESMALPALGWQACPRASARSQPTGARSSKKGTLPKLQDTKRSDWVISFASSTAQIRVPPLAPQHYKHLPKSFNSLGSSFSSSSSGSRSSQTHIMRAHRCCIDLFPSCRPSATITLSNNTREETGCNAKLQVICSSIRPRYRYSCHCVARRSCASLPTPVQGQQRPCPVSPSSVPACH